TPDSHPLSLHDALPICTEAVGMLERVLADQPHHPKGRQFLRNASWERATALGALKRHAEAVKDWDRAVALDTGTARPLLRSNRRSEEHTSELQSLTNLV